MAKVASDMGIFELLATEGSSPVSTMELADAAQADPVLTRELRPRMLTPGTLLLLVCAER